VSRATAVPVIRFGSTGADAPLVLSGPRHTHAVEVYDFYKPRGDTEYATVDGKLSQNAYLTAVDTCWAGLKSKLARAKGGDFSLDSFDYVCMHSPYNKLVQKGFARLLVGDFTQQPDRKEFEDVPAQWRGVPLSESVDNRDVEKCFVGLSKASG